MENIHNYRPNHKWCHEFKFFIDTHVTIPNKDIFNPPLSFYNSTRQRNNRSKTRLIRIEQIKTENWNSKEEEKKKKKIRGIFGRKKQKKKKKAAN